MSKKYLDSGLMSHARNKKSDSSPDFYGEVEFSEDTIRYLAGQLRDGSDPKLRVAIWRKSNDKGTYLKLVVSEPLPGGGGGGQRRNDDRRAQNRQSNDVFDDDRSREGSRRSNDYDDDIPF